MMTTKKMFPVNSALFIQGLELRVYLGWPDDERSQKQVVLLDVDIWFAKPPDACVTDKLDDTICYASLIQFIHDHLAERTFHLIEHLTQTIYHLIKSQLSDQTKTHVRITKHPDIAGLTRGVCFGYGDNK